MRAYYDAGMAFTQRGDPFGSIEKIIEEGVRHEIEVEVKMLEAGSDGESSDDDDVDESSDIESATNNDFSEASHKEGYDNEDGGKDGHSNGSNSESHTDLETQCIYSNTF